MRPAFLLLSIALFAAAAAVAWWLLRRRRARPAPRARRAPPAYPVVLAHGLFGFDEVAVAGKRVEYFRGVPKRLRGMGAEVHVARMPPIGSVERRAEKLAEVIRAIEAERVNVVAHSMGGVDARWAISKLGLGDRIASLTTIGTPHGGTPLADAGAKALGPLARVLDLRGIEDAGVARMRRFNVEVKDEPGVAYFSVVAAMRQGPRRMSKLLVPAWAWLKSQAGDNDGIVPAESQHQGEALFEVEADHWAQIGWGGQRFDAPDLYAEIVRALRARGL